MSEMAEMFSHMKEASQKKRASNRTQSARILAEAGIDFEQHNDGAHIVIKRNGRAWDFWPGTGKWHERGTKIYRRGVMPLIKALPLRLNAVDHEENYWRGEMLQGEGK